MKNKIRMLATWTVIGLLIQFGAYSFLEYKITQVMSPPKPEAITTKLEADIPGTNLQNVQVSYAKDYLAYIENGALKVYNMEQGRIVFEKGPVPGSNKNMGILNYQWLPDRNTLIYFYAQKNPNPVTTEVIKPIQKSPTVAASENPVKESGEESHTSNEPQVVKKYNPQLTELYTLELPDSKELTSPDDRLNRAIDSFPENGKITQMEFSTYTNLIYLTVDTEKSTRLLEIDVMQNVRILNQPGERIYNIAVSDRHGTLYLDSKLNGEKKISALNSWKRDMVFKDPGYTVLGDRDGVLYLGEIKNNKLTKVIAAEDRVDSKEKLEFKTVWEGSVPVDDSQIIVGADKQVIVYGDKAVYVIKDGRAEQPELDGDLNLVSQDGAELIGLSPNGSATHVNLKPLK